jgi:hypothetical protein
LPKGVGRGAITDKAASPGVLGNFFPLTDTKALPLQRSWECHFSGTSMFGDDGISRPKANLDSGSR